MRPPCNGKPLGQDAGRLIGLELQNEHLVALERGRLLASVPDLITMLDSETADAISADRVSYGQRVVVIAFGCDPNWRTERGIAAAPAGRIDTGMAAQPARSAK